ncbi:MAG TPA: efflux RND transporter periplasmic adaptor subunit [Blastocatellia bacterium]|nr:efflux RND transporter periplasmic adaptor subunit [Blastocatellia bacterium]
MAVDNRSLDERLKSLRIDRSPGGSGNNKQGVPRMALLGLSIVVAVVAVSAYLFLNRSRTVTAADVTVESGGAAAGDTVLTVSGYVVAAHRIAVGSKVLGRVEWIGVDKGDKVEKGQVLVRLEDSEFRTQVAQARANVALAQARLDELKSGSRPQEKQRDRATVSQAEANLRDAELEFGRIEQLYRAGVTSKAEFDRAQARRDVARSQLETARESSKLTDLGPREEQVRAAAAEVDQMKAALAYAETQLANTVITAPVTGTVLQRIVELGEMVSPSAFGDSGTRTAVVSLADLNDLQIELDISQADFSKLKMDQPAEIIPEAYPNLRYKGFIEEIAPEANRAKATVQIKVKVENPDEQLRPEMNARVNFLAPQQKAPEATQAVSRVLVPAAAVVSRGGSDFVFVVKGDRVEMRTIRKGEASGDRFYVLDGLAGGERVVTKNAESLGDGDHVRIEGQ